MLFKEAKNPLTILRGHSGTRVSIKQLDIILYNIAVLAELKVNENYSVGG